MIKSHELFDTVVVTESGAACMASSTETTVRTKVQSRNQRPQMFKVVLLNDDYTPMDFVVDVLMYIFHKPNDEATRLMLEIHNSGAAICGVYTRDIAETLADQTLSLARRNDHPLQCIVEST